MNVQELVDRQLIMDRLHRYCELLDTGRAEAVPAEVFTEDVVEDHGEGLPVNHGRGELGAFLRRALEPFAACMHLLTNHSIAIDGDHATSSAYYMALHWFEREDVDQRPADWISVGRYADVWRRTPDGWRIASRRRENVGPSSVAVGVRPTHLVEMRGSSPDA